jgi:hypothetical protein
VASYVFRFGQLTTKWRMIMLEERVSVLNDAPIRLANVWADAGGAIVDPSTFPVQMAFITTDRDPVSGDWKTAAWDVTQTGNHCVEINVGPSGAALSIGEYYAWVRVQATNPTETPIAQIGQLIVQ